MHLFNPFKRKPRPGTSIRPDYKKLIQFAFEIDGVEFFEFKNIIDMPALRYQAESRFITEMTLGINLKDLKSTIEKSLEFLDKGNITKSIIEQGNILELTKKIIKFDAIYNLAACHYFYKDENLDNYDYDIGEEKIELFKAQSLESFFLNTPIKQFLPDQNLSATDLATYYQYEKELQKLRFKS